MRVLIDTNIVLDFLLNRDEYFKDANQIISKCAAKEIHGIIAAHTISNMFFIMRKQYSVQERKLLLKNMCKIFEVAGIDVNTILVALENEDFDDFEDCLQMRCAVNTNAQYIVTRNPSDFTSSIVPVVSPKEIVTMI
ncbi:MAG: PIN domain-containing protein [Lachnospira sp.]|nr:PIN domain-containing protein [Lachnospira sp.]